MASPSEMKRLRASAARIPDAAVFVQTFDLALRATSPDLASALAACPAGADFALLLSAAILAVEEGEPGPAFRAFESLRRQVRFLPRHDAAVGLALIAALDNGLGKTFDDATQDAWTNAYVGLVEGLVAARHNRIDLVA